MELAFVWKTVTIDDGPTYWLLETLHDGAFKVFKYEDGKGNESYHCIGISQNSYLIGFDTLEEAKQHVEGYVTYLEAM